MARRLLAVVVSALVAGCSGLAVSTDGGSGGGAAGGSAGGGSGGSGGAGGAGGGSGGGSAGGAAGGSAGGGTGGSTLASRYPGDVGLAGDPDVVWTENFEEANVTALTARYNQCQNTPGITLVADVPTGSSGQHSGKFTSDGTSANATDMYKNFGAGYQELYVRYYAKYQGGAVPWHHTGVWFGGYNPATNWPNPQAGLKPNGDDRFAVSFEPMGTGPAARMDFYNYWSTMQSWMAVPSGSTAYYGNTLIHDPAVHYADDAWFCVEIHLKLNPDPASSAGAELGLWVNDAPVVQFTDSAPLGYWVRDKFCLDTAVGTECTTYRPANPTLVPLDLRWRTVAALTLNYFWPQNYITTAGATGSVQYDDMVVAKSRVGCLR
jgi:hypothetical protein